MPPSSEMAPRVTSPPEITAPPRAGPPYPGPSHGHSSSMDSNISNDSTASSATVTSTRPLNPVQRRNTGLFPKPLHQPTDFPREKPHPNTNHLGGYYTGEAGAPPPVPAQTPYMNMLLSLDRIPRLHNILVSVFVWILLAGFVVIPGSFTSRPMRKQEGGASSATNPVVGGGGSMAEKLALAPANTAAMVVGFVCIVAGTFGAAWLALRWRRNYVWLLNKLYLPLILDALAGVLAAVVTVYTQQAGVWSTQAVAVAVVEGAVLGVSVMFFFVYNYWLLQRVRSEHEEVVMGEKGGRGRGKRRKEKKRGGWLARFRRVRRKPPIAAGSVV
ncbi:hypothetical protein VTI74DRAFT_9633 [Chaetomium olivicolor]